MASLDTEPKNGSSMPSGTPNWTSWPSQYQVLKMLDLRMRAVQKLCKEGVLRSIRTPLGQIRIDPKSVDEYLSERADAPDLFDDDSDSDAAAARQGVPAEAIRATGELLKAAQQQNLELHKLVIQGFKASHEAQARTIEQLQSRVDKAESVITQLYEAREKYFDSQLEREIAATQMKSAEARRQEIWTTTSGYMGSLVEGLKSKWGIQMASASPQVTAVIELLKSLQPVQIEAAAQMGFFTPEQVAWIEKILGRKIGAENATKSD